MATFRSSLFSGEDEPLTTIKLVYKKNLMESNSFSKHMKTFANTMPSVLSLKIKTDILAISNSEVLRVELSGGERNLPATLA